MDERQKLIWLLFAVQNTINTRFTPSEELKNRAAALLQLVSIELDPEMDIPVPRVHLMVTDFKLPNDVAERASPPQAA